MQKKGKKNIYLKNKICFLDTALEPIDWDKKNLRKIPT